MNITFYCYVYYLIFSVPSSLTLIYAKLLSVLNIHLILIITIKLEKIYKSECKISFAKTVFASLSMLL